MDNLLWIAMAGAKENFNSLNVKLACHERVW